MARKQLENNSAAAKKIDTAQIYILLRSCVFEQCAIARAAGRWATERTANIYPNTHTHTHTHTHIYIIRRSGETV
jgi:hypothetical protein